MPTPIKYPEINGARHSWSSVILKIDGQQFDGVKSITYARHREIGTGYGTNPDPLFNTRGKNSYEGEIEVYHAEWIAFVVEHFGKGYGDKYFAVEVSYAENGFPTTTDRLIGCRVLDSEGGGSEGTDPLTRKFKLNPLKIIFHGTDDNATPLHGPRAQA